MGSPSGGLSGSLLESSRPPDYTRQTASWLYGVIRKSLQRDLVNYTIAGRYFRPVCSMETMTHNSRLATATIARFLPRRLANASKMLRQRLVRYTNCQENVPSPPHSLEPEVEGDRLPETI